MSGAYEALFTIVLVALGALMFPCLLRSILGPRVADRVVGINMIGTIAIVMVAVLAVMLREGYLVDVAIIYAMLSFLAVVILSKVYIGIYEEQRHMEQNPDAKEEGDMSDGSF